MEPDGNPGLLAAVIGIPFLVGVACVGYLVWLAVQRRIGFRPAFWAWLVVLVPVVGPVVTVAITVVQHQRAAEAARRH